MWTVQFSLACGLRAKVVVIGNSTLLAPQWALHGEPQEIAPVATYWVFVGPARRLQGDVLDAVVDAVVDVHAGGATSKEFVAKQEVRQVPLRTW